MSSLIQNENSIASILNDIEELDSIIDVENSRDLQAQLIRFSDYEIIESIGMADLPLVLFLLSIKYQEKPVLIPIENDIMIRVGECNVANMSYLPVLLHFFIYEEQLLVIEGTGSYPTVLDQYAIRCNIDGAILDSKMNDYSDDQFLGKQKYEERRGFRFEIKLSGNQEISFLNNVNGFDCYYGKINSMRFAPISDVLPGQYYATDEYAFYIEGRKICCKKINVNEQKIYENRFLLEIKKITDEEKWTWIKELREYYFNHKRDKKIFLLMDRPDRADDNAKVFFKFIQERDDIESYFLLEEDSRDFAEIKKIGNAVKIYSKQHFQLALIADYIISSQCNGMIENPFWNDSEYFRDLYHRPKFVFLQHGVIKDDMSPTLNRYNTNFYGFVTSTKDEYESILRYPYFYSKNEVWLTGLPRFDELYDAKGKTILVMPTWRKGLMQQEWNQETRHMDWIPIEKIEDTMFYKRYMSFLNNSFFQVICRMTGYKVLFVAHPLFKKVISQEKVNDLCEFASENVSYRELFAKGTILITDYSSVAFDFAYLKKPIIYYQFDKKDFYEKHTYVQGYFDYKKNGMGPVVQTEIKLILKIVLFVLFNKAGFVKYKKRQEALFSYRDRNDCNRILNCIFGERNEEKIL